MAAALNGTAILRFTNSFSDSFPNVQHNVLSGQFWIRFEYDPMATKIFLNAEGSRGRPVLPKKRCLARISDYVMAC